MSASLRARRRFEVLEARFSPSDTLFIAAAAIAASQSETRLIAPPKYAEPNHWTPEKMAVQSIVPPTRSNQITIKPESIDGLLESEADIEPNELVELGETLGDDPQRETPAEPAPPRPAAPTPLAAGVGPGTAPGGAAAPGGGGGGGGGGAGGTDAGANAAAAAHMLTTASTSTTPTSTVTTNSFNPNLIANNDSFTLAHDTFQSGTVIDNDIGAGTVVQDSSPINGLLQLDPGGSFTYQPSYHFVGIDSFTYHLVDVFGDFSNTATVTFDVQEHAPKGVNDSYTLQHDRPFIVTYVSDGVLGNDSDVDQSDLNLTASLVTGPTNGQLQLNSDGTFVYTPNPGYLGADSFTYNAVDTLGETSTATATLNVVDPNRPVAVNDGVDPSGNVIWRTSWRETAADQSSYGNNVVVNTDSTYGNDYDPDADPLTPILDSDPAGGSLQRTIDANGNWTGDFTYTPAVGFYGTDTFTYHVTDGALQSAAVATVSIFVQMVNIGLWDGGPAGQEVPPDKETTRGAYAVVNSNNTNGDYDSTGSAIVDSTQHPVVAATDANNNKVGRDEVDLMKLAINKPNGAKDGEKLTLAWSDGLEIWSDSIKTTHLDSMETGSNQYYFDVKDLPKILYVEAVAGSTHLRDMQVSAYFKEAQDFVSVTGMWAALTGKEFATKAPADVIAEFSDMDSTMKSSITALGGTGMAPQNPTQASGLGMGHVLQWTIEPPRDPVKDRSWEDDNIHFDSTQMVEYKLWEAIQRAGPPYTLLKDEPFPTVEEQANDDIPNAVESNAVTSANHFYTYDRPGPKPGNPPDGFEFIFRGNFKTWLRVGIDEAIGGGVGVQGSRVSRTTIPGMRALMLSRETTSLGSGI